MRTTAACSRRYVHAGGAAPTSQSGRAVVEAGSAAVGVERARMAGLSKRAQATLVVVLSAVALALILPAVSVGWAESGSWGVNGNFVARVDPGSPAARAGIVPGDVFHTTGSPAGVRAGAVRSRRCSAPAMSITSAWLFGVDNDRFGLRAEPAARYDGARGGARLLPFAPIGRGALAPRARGFGLRLARRDDREFADRLEVVLAPR